MPRPGAGEVTERPWKDGTTITYGARIYAYGRRHRLTFGTNLQGWNHTRAQIEIESISQQVTRGTWLPPEHREPTVSPAPNGGDGQQSFEQFARRVIEAKKSHGLDEDTIADLDRKLGYLVGHFGNTQLCQIDVAATDAFRDELAARSRAIRSAQERGRPLMETVTPRNGRPYKRRKKPLANSSINGILALLSQILQRAVDYGHIDRNPLKTGTHRDRFLPAVKPNRTFLEVDELHALLDAAGELDDAARRDQRTGRRAALATLALCGLRISELCELKCNRVDLARARLKLPDAKTLKGVREIEVAVWLHRELELHAAQRMNDGFPMGPEHHFFGTATGNARDPDRFRDRILARSVALTNERRAEHGHPPLPERITPHSLRRTWAMLAAQAGRDPHWISDQIGHVSAAFTLQVYQQTRHRRLTPEERQAVWRLMRFADEPEDCPFTR
ncbi:MAG: tyrosine-type recombinase/integrase [Solirubrobacteraceae bacterium]